MGQKSKTQNVTTQNSKCDKNQKIKVFICDSTTFSITRKKIETTLNLK